MQPITPDPECRVVVGVPLLPIITIPSFSPCALRWVDLGNEYRVCAPEALLGAGFLHFRSFS